MCIRDSLYDAYTDIKHRKGESRTYFLDKLRERLNLRMQRDDEKERERRRWLNNADGRFCPHFA